nr:transposase [Capsulimonas corticalis]
MTNRKSYTEEFKREAIRLAEEKGNLSAVARDLGIAESLIAKWKKSLQSQPENPFPGKGNPSDPELAQLKRDYARLKEENEILNASRAGAPLWQQKAVGIFTSRPQ